MTHPTDLRSILSLPAVANGTLWFRPVQWTKSGIARWSSEPSVGRVVHGLPRGLAGWRRASISALGNAVVPQVAEVIGRRIVEHVRSSHAPQVES